MFSRNLDSMSGWPYLSHIKGLLWEAISETNGLQSNINQGSTKGLSNRQSGEKTK